MRNTKILLEKVLSSVTLHPSGTICLLVKNLRLRCKISGTEWSTSSLVIKRDLRTNSIQFRFLPTKTSNSNKQFSGCRNRLPKRQLKEVSYRTPQSKIRMTRKVCDRMKSNDYFGRKTFLAHKMEPNDLNDRRR